ncbi:unnamed protein product [Hymenolepis diminuta]|uniref:RT36 n=1 Tax=Hymenolepis diminuta TaxID=6216 RepID=A0A0R3S969_HYMDI|nr:unnamed protein product [Hymenolepis diminuta]VUZ47367.1 unnamed protein product [Hymenolepis diminuta]
MTLAPLITPVINLDVKAAPDSKPTLLSLAQKRNRERQGQEGLTPLDVVRSRIMEQRNSSSSKSLCSSPPPSNSAPQQTPQVTEGEGENSFDYKAQAEDPFFKQADKIEDEMQEDKDLIQI